MNTPERDAFDQIESMGRFQSKLSEAVEQAINDGLIPALMLGCLQSTIGGVNHIVDIRLGRKENE